MKKFALRYSLMILTLGAVTCTAGMAQSYQSTTTVTESPAVRLDSWMQPTVTRTRRITNDRGETVEVTEPLIQERHERVMIPFTRTETTTEVHHQPIVTETRRTTSSSMSSSTTSGGSYRVRMKPVHRKRHVAYNRAHRSSLTARTIQSSSIIERKQRTEEGSMTVERRDPALDIIDTY